MPPKKIGISAVMFDANSQPEFKTRAIECYKQICSAIRFSDDRSISKLLLSNSDKRQLTDYVYFEPSNRASLETAKAVPGDWLLDLQYAVYDLHKQYDEKTYFKYQILVLSDLKTPTDSDKGEIERKIKGIVERLNEIYCYVYFVGVDIKPDSLLKGKKEVYNWVQSMNVEESNLNYSIALRIVKESAGVMCNFDIGADLFLSYCEGEKGQPYVEPLTFGNDLIFGTMTTKFLDPSPSFNPKPEKQFISERFVLTEDQDVEVERYNTTEGLVIHDKLICIPKDVKKGIQDYPRFFKLLGFTDEKNVPVHYMLSESTDILINNENVDPTHHVIDYVIESAKKHKQYGIALRAYMKNTMPKLYCLIPHVNPHYFLMVQLPYAEDFVLPYKEQDLNTYKEELAVKDGKTEDDKTKDDKTEDKYKMAVYKYLDSVSLEDNIQIHPILRQSDSKKRSVDMLTDKMEEKELKNTPLVFLGVEFEEDEEVIASIEKKFKVEEKQEEQEDLW